MTALGRLWCRPISTPLQETDTVPAYPVFDIVYKIITQTIEQIYQATRIRKTNSIVFSSGYPLLGLSFPWAILSLDCPLLGLSSPWASLLGYLLLGLSSHKKRILWSGDCMPSINNTTLLIHNMHLLLSFVDCCNSAEEPGCLICKSTLISPTCVLFPKWQQS